MAEPTGVNEPTATAALPAENGAPAETNGAPAHQPYVPDSANLPEFTLPAVLVGAVLGIVFGASSLYLVLKVGLTVSASIPVAVLSITLFRVFSRYLPIRRATILENNIVQTTGSAGESIAFGVGVTMPALMLLGFEMNVGRVLVVSVLGGLLGILMMIPLRRAFIVKLHGSLKYPEGTACADVLIAGEKGGATAKTVFIGFGVAFVYEFLRLGFKFFQEAPEKALRFFKQAVPAIEVNPALLGVGYIIGTRISAVMCAGGVLAAFVLIPAVSFFGAGSPVPLFPGDKPIDQMSAEDIGHQYVLYIGAGAVAAGGIISVFQALPLIWSSIVAGLRDIRASRGGNGARAGRTDRDLPLATVGFGALFLVIAIWATHPLHQQYPWVPDLHMNPLGACLIVLFGFLFVTVSSRLTGQIGSSSNPISGMTVATLLLTCLIFVVIGWVGPEYRLTALSVAAVVCIAASNGGTTSQDLKTGYLVGATPKWQQYAILVGALTSALVIGFILIWLNDAYTVYTTKNLPTPETPIDVKALTETARAPDDDTEYHVWRAAEGNPQGVKPGMYLVDDQGTIHYLVDPGINGQRRQRDDGTEVPRFKAPKAALMALITDGILRGRLPWSLVLLGVSIAVVLELCGIPSLAFAVGVYLPLSASTPILAGGLVRYVVDRWRRKPPVPTPEGGEAPPADDSDTSPGALLATGYIAGGAIAGVLIAFLSFSDEIPRAMARWQYRTWATTEKMPVDDAFKTAAKPELGITGDPRKQLDDLEKSLPKEGKGTLSKEQQDERDRLQLLVESIDDKSDAISDLNGDLVPRFWPVPAGVELKLPKGEKMTTTAETTLGQVALEKLKDEHKAQLLLTLNLDHLVKVKKGAKLRLPLDKRLFEKDGGVTAIWDKKKKRFVVQDKTYVAPDDMTLAGAAERALGKADRAHELYELNAGALRPEIQLPAGTALKLPQPAWPALVAFGALVTFLILVGVGVLFREAPPATGNGPAIGNGPSPRGDGDPDSPLSNLKR
jgi:putative OPT family oligopeptide transporter